MITRSHKLAPCAVPPSGAGVPGGDPASAAAPGVAPRAGITGGKSPTDALSWHTRTITCHWLRVIHQAEDHERVRQYLVNRFGEPDQVRGRWFYEFGERFSNGILLLSGAIVGKGDDQEDDDAAPMTVCVDVPGGALDELDSLDRAQVCFDLCLGGRVSRIDLAVDAYAANQVGLIDAIIASCSAGELCGAKRWQPMLSYDGCNLVGKGVTIGKRGNLGSGRYVRVYDKGLESGEQSAGKWERYEVEFSSDCGAEVAAYVFGDLRDWESRAWERVLGAISFREDDSSNGELARRDLKAWWRQWIEGHDPLPTIMYRQQTTLERHVLWLRKTVLPTVARLAEAARLPWADALVELVGADVKPRSCDRYMRTMLEDWLLHLQGIRSTHDGGWITCEPRRVAAA